MCECVEVFHWKCFTSVRRVPVIGRTRFFWTPPLPPPPPPPLSLFLPQRHPSLLPTQTSNFINSCARARACVCVCVCVSQRACNQPAEENERIKRISRRRRKRSNKLDNVLRERGQQRFNYSGNKTKFRFNRGNKRGKINRVQQRMNPSF